MRVRSSRWSIKIYSPGKGETVWRNPLRLGRVDRRFRIVRPRESGHRCGMTDPKQLDDFDHQILRHLQRDALATGEEIGAEIALSAAAVQRRIKRLRQMGAI